MVIQPTTVARSLYAAAALAISAQSYAVQFVTPLGGQPFKDWTIVNYVDTNPGAGVSDYRGGIYSYSGHDAIDFTLPNFAAMSDECVPFAVCLKELWKLTDGASLRPVRHPDPDTGNYFAVAISLLIRRRNSVAGVTACHCSVCIAAYAVSITRTDAIASAGVMMSSSVPQIAPPKFLIWLPNAATLS